MGTQLGHEIAPQTPANPVQRPTARIKRPPSARLDFLANLRSKGRYRYSRYNGIPLRYAGGKSLAVGHVVEQLPRKVDFLVSPFIGGGSVEIACARELGIPVRGYDIFDILVTYWKAQLNSPLKLAERIAAWKPNQRTTTR